jgi:hypothetical protein
VPPPLGPHAAGPIERQDPEIRRWLGQEYPKIAARAKAKWANIHADQATRISNQPIHGRNAQRHTTSMISTVTDGGRIWFMLHEGAVNAAHFFTFLERLSRSASGKIFLIVDTVIADHVKAINQWVVSQRKIELFFLPPYPREHDSDALSNGAVKRRRGDQLTVDGETLVVQGEPERRDPDRLAWALDVRPE